MDVTGAAASLPGGLVSVESHNGGMSGTNRVIQVGYWTHYLHPMMAP